MMDGATTALIYPFQEPPDPGAAIEVAPGILWMRLPLPMRLNHVNVYALDDGETWTLIDTGMASRTSKAAWQVLLDGPLGGKPVARVLVTHHHPDHVGLAGWFQTEMGAEVWMTRACWYMTRALCLDEQPVPTPSTLDYLRKAGAADAWIDVHASKRPFNLGDLCDPLGPGFTRVAEGAVLRMGGRDWDVRFGEGHAAEQITLWCRDDPLVLAADQILPTITPVLGVFPSEPAADPMQEYLTSLGQMRAHARADQLVLPGHKLPFYGLPQRIDALVREHRDNLDKLVAFLAEPRVATDCFHLLFRSKIDDENFLLAISETVACLNHLQNQGRVTRADGSGGAWHWQATRDATDG